MSFLVRPAASMLLSGITNLAGLVVEGLGTELLVLALASALEPPPTTTPTRHERHTRTSTYSKRPGSDPMPHRTYMRIHVHLHLHGTRAINRIAVWPRSHPICQGCCVLPYAHTKSLTCEAHKPSTTARDVPVHSYLAIPVTNHQSPAGSLLIAVPCA